MTFELTFTFYIWNLALFVDVGKNYSIIDTPQLAFVYDYVGTKEVHQFTGADQYVFI